MADRGELDQIRQAVDIVGLVSETVQLKKRGKEHVALCPFHNDRHPSFTVSDRTGRYKCWSCGESGDIFTWVMQTQKVDFKEAIDILADRAGATLSKGKSSEDRSRTKRLDAVMALALEFFRSSLKSSETAREYCASREISQASIDTWEIGYAPDAGDALWTTLLRHKVSVQDATDLFLVDSDGKGRVFDKFRGRLMFPIRDDRDRLVAFGGRLLRDGQPKYINSSDTPLYSKRRVLYGMNKAKGPIERSAAKAAYLVEGYLDVIACHQHGLSAAVASLGTALSEEQCKLMGRWCENVLVMYDADDAGVKAADRAVDLVRAAGMGARIAVLPGGVDPDTLLKTSGVDATIAAMKGGYLPLEFKISQIKYPVNSEDYWTTAIDAIAKEKSLIQRSNVITKLAAIHPGEADPERAEMLIKRAVLAAQPSEVTSESPKCGPLLLRGLQRVEVTIFAAFMDANLRKRAWGLMFDPELFVTHAARGAASVIAATFDEAAPKGQPIEWLDDLDPETVELLAEIDSWETTEEMLDACVDRLSRMREERERRSLEVDSLDDSRLRALGAKISSSKH